MKYLIERFWNNSDQYWTTAQRLLVIPSSTMSCILQHDDMILELNWSTTRTWRIITQLWFVCFIHKKDRNVFKSQRKQIYWKYKTYFPFARLLQSAYHVLHDTYTTYRNLGIWNHFSSWKRLIEKAKLTLSDHSFQRHGDNLKRNRKTKMANSLVAWPNRRCTGYTGHVLRLVPLSFSVSLDWRSGSWVCIPLSAKSRTVWCGLVHFHISVNSFTGEITFRRSVSSWTCC